MSSPGMDVAARYPLIGGFGAWRIPALTALLASWATLQGEWTVGLVVVVLGIALGGLDRSLVVEVSAGGLTRGVLLGGKFLPPSLVMPWHSVVEIRTEWRRPGDGSALVTEVRGRDGAVIWLSSAMGLGPYLEALAQIVRLAPAAARSGLTEEVLAEAPPDLSRALPALVAASVAALVTVLAIVV